MLLKALSLAMAALICCSTLAAAQDATLLLENRAQDTAQNLPHPLDVCDEIFFGPADRAFVIPPQENPAVSAILYPSRQACIDRTDRIALVPPNVDTPIGDGHPVQVGAVRMVAQ